MNGEVIQGREGLQTVWYRMAHLQEARSHLTNMHSTLIEGCADGVSFLALRTAPLTSRAHLHVSTEIAPAQSHGFVMKLLVGNIRISCQGDKNEASRICATDHPWHYSDSLGSHTDCILPVSDSLSDNNLKIRLSFRGMVSTAAVGPRL